MSTARVRSLCELSELHRLAQPLVEQALRIVRSRTSTFPVREKAACVAASIIAGVGCTDAELRDLMETARCVAIEEPELIGALLNRLLGGEDDDRVIPEVVGFIDWLQVRGEHRRALELAMTLLTVDCARHLNRLPIERWVQCMLQTLGPGSEVAALVRRAVAYFDCVPSWVGPLVESHPTLITGAHVRSEYILTVQTAHPTVAGWRVLAKRPDDLPTTGVPIEVAEFGERLPRAVETLSRAVELTRDESQRALLDAWLKELAP